MIRCGSSWLIAEGRARTQAGACVQQVPWRRAPPKHHACQPCSPSRGWWRIRPRLTHTTAMTPWGVPTAAHASRSAWASWAGESVARSVGNGRSVCNVPVLFHPLKCSKELHMHTSNQNHAACAPAPLTPQLGAAAAVCDRKTGRLTGLCHHGSRRLDQCSYQLHAHSRLGAHRQVSTGAWQSLWEWSASVGPCSLRPATGVQVEQDSVRCAVGCHSAGVPMGCHRVCCRRRRSHVRVSGPEGPSASVPAAGTRTRAWPSGPAAPHGAW